MSYFERLEVEKECALLVRVLEIVRKKKGIEGCEWSDDNKANYGMIENLLQHDYPQLSDIAEEILSFTSGKQLRYIADLESKSVTTTLGCYELNDSKIKELIDWVEYLSSKTKVIEFKFNSIGTFLHNEKYPKTDVIYAAPTIPKKLYELYCDYHKKFDEYSSEVGRDYSMINGQPTIHSTITICNKNEYKKAIDFIWTNFKPMISKIKSIKIYKMNKELIKSVNLKGVDQ